MFPAHSLSSSTSSPLSCPCFQSIFLSLTSLLLLSPRLVSVGFGFSAFPSLILQKCHSGFRADLSLRVPLRKKRGKERKGEKRRGRNGERLCLREGHTEIEVTNLSKSPAETESATERQGKEKKERRLYRDLLLQEIHLNIPC